MRPCSECGGSGTTTEADSWGPNECPRCADMPWLPCPTHVETKVGGIKWDLIHDRCGGRGRFKPDPDSVIAWCFNHDQPMVWDNKQCALWEDAKPYYECDPGWVARPQRLETVE